MSEKPSNEFTDREKFLLSYYRDKELSSSPRLWLFDAAIVCVSLFMFIYFLTNSEVPFAFVAYALVLGRLYYYTSESGRWTRDLQSIIAKYDGRIQELTKSVKEQRGSE